MSKPTTSSDASSYSAGTWRWRRHLGATGPVPGTSVTTSIGMDSVVLTFNFALAE